MGLQAQPNPAGRMNNTQGCCLYSTCRPCPDLTSPLLPTAACDPPPAQFIAFPLGIFFGGLTMLVGGVRLSGRRSIELAVRMEQDKGHCLPVVLSLAASSSQRWGLTLPACHLPPHPCRLSLCWRFCAATRWAAPHSAPTVRVTLNDASYALCTSGQQGASFSLTRAPATPLACCSGAFWISVGVYGVIRTAGVAGWGLGQQRSATVQPPTSIAPGLWSDLWPQALTSQASLPAFPISRHLLPGRSKGPGGAYRAVWSGLHRLHGALGPLCAGARMVCRNPCPLPALHVFLPTHYDAWRLLSHAVPSGPTCTAGRVFRHQPGPALRECCFP